MSWMDDNWNVHSENFTVGNSPFTVDQVGIFADVDAISGHTWVHVSPPSGINIRALKLELGEVSTLAEDCPPSYGAELAKCELYYWKATNFTGNRYFLGYWRTGLGLYVPLFNCRVRSRFSGGSEYAPAFQGAVRVRIAQGQYSTINDFDVVPSPGGLYLWKSMTVPEGLDEKIALLLDTFEITNEQMYPD